MEISADIVRGILERQLAPAAVERLLAELPDAGKAQLLLRIAGVARRNAALVDVANRVSDTLSLDILFTRLLEVVTESLDAERGSLFLHDADTGELFSRVMQGNAVGEVRFPVGQGIAGSVFSSGRGEIIPDAYADARFNRWVDTETGYRTRNLLCVPIRNNRNEIIGVTQALNKRSGDFDSEDMQALEALASQAAAALENARLFERVERSQREEALLLDVVSLITSEIKLDPLLEKILTAATQLLGADRGSLFLYDAAKNELWSRVTGGEGSAVIRFPASAGIAGECFTTGNCINIDDAYRDPRFNQAVDRDTGYRTRNILCMPIATRGGNKVGVMEILNKKEGAFTAGDQRRLEALCAQAAVSIENAQLFKDVSDSRNYNESILRSMSNGVVTMDAGNTITKVNPAVTGILGMTEAQLHGRTAGEIFGNRNEWVLKSLDKVRASGKSDISVDTDLLLAGRKSVSVNMTTVPLVTMQDQTNGFMLVIEDISMEKRMRNTMSRYMSKVVVDKLLEGGERAVLRHPRFHHDVGAPGCP